MQIYLAISLKKELDLIYDKLAKKISKELIYIINNEEEVDYALQTTNNLLIFDITTLQNRNKFAQIKQSKNEIWILNTLEVEIKDSKERFSIFKSSKELITAFSFKDLNVVVDTNKAPEPDTIILKEKNNLKDSVLSKHQESGEVAETTYIEDDYDYPPVETNPYPPNNKEIQEFIESVKQLDESAFMAIKSDELLYNAMQTLVKNALKGRDIKEIMIESDQRLAKIFARKEIIDQNYLNKNKSIALWSPISKVGTSTLLINLAIYLSKMGMYITVAEAVRSQPYLKKELERFTKSPQGWISYISFLEKKNLSISKSINTFWEYKNVNWYPLTSEDPHLYNIDSTNFYYSGIKDTSFTFFDLPSGKMKEQTKAALKHIDELWIVSDGVDSNLLKYKESIHATLTNYKLKGNLIFLKHFPFKKERKLAKSMGIPPLAIIKDLSSEVDKNAFQKKPLIEKEFGYKHLEKPFMEILKYLDTDKQFNSNVFNRPLTFRLRP